MRCGGWASHGAHSVLLLGLLFVGAIQGARAEDTLAKAFQSRDLARAETILAERLRRDPTEINDQYNFAMVSLMKGLYERAIQYFKRVSTQDHPLGSLSRIYIARCLRETGALAEAAQVLQQIDSSSFDPEAQVILSREKHKYTEASLRAGLENYNAGHYSEALAMISLSVESEPTVDARLLKAVTLLRLDQRSEARALLVELDTPAARELVREITLAEKKAQVPWSVALELAGGYNSNVYFTASQQQETTPRANAPILAQNATVERVAPAIPGTLERVRFLENYEEALSLPGLRSILLSLQLETEVLVRTDFTFAIAPEIRTEFDVDGLTLLKPGVIARSSLKRDLDLYSIEIEYLRDLAKRTYLNYLDGHSFSVALGATLHYAKFELGPSLGYARELNQDLTAPGARLPLQYWGAWGGLALRFSPAPAWLISTEPSWSWRSYDHVAVPHDVHRDDLAFNGSLRVDRSFPQTWGLYAAVNFLFNQSTLGHGNVADKNFQQFRSFIGVTWKLVR